MNKYQTIAFSAAAMLAFAFLVAWTTQLSGLGFVLILAFIVALLTLPLTWKLILTIIQSVSVVVASIGHVIGIIGDEIVYRCKAGKTWLNGNNDSSRVPSWESFQLVSDESTDDLDVPSFVKDAMDRQQV